MINIVFFAQVRELLGINKTTISAENINTVQDIADQLEKQFPKWSMVAGENLCLCAVNQTLVGFSTKVKSGDEVAFFPPVTGG